MNSRAHAAAEWNPKKIARWTGMMRTMMAEESERLAGLERQRRVRGRCVVDGATQQLELELSLYLSPAIVPACSDAK